MKSSGDSSSTTATSLSHHKTAADSCVSFALSSRRRKVVSFIPSLPSRALPLLHRSGSARWKTAIPSTVSFVLYTKVVEKGRKASLQSVLSQAAATSKIQAEKTLRSCMAVPQPWAVPSLHQLHSRALTLQLAVIHSPWSILVSSRCSPPYNTGLSEHVTGKKSIQRCLCAHTSYSHTRSHGVEDKAASMAHSMQKKGQWGQSLCSSSSGQDGVSGTKISHPASLFREQGSPPCSTDSGLHQILQLAPFCVSH